MNKTNLALALAGLLTVSGVGAFAASAAENTTNNNSTNETTQANNMFGKGGHRHAIDRSAMHEATLNALGITVEEADQAREDGKTLHELAEEKGIPVDTFVNAMKQAKADALEQAVKDGNLTQEQADAMLEQQNEHFADVESYDDLGNLKGERGMHRGGFKLSGTFETNMLNALGITEEEADQAREDGKALHELAEEKGVPIDTFVNALKQAKADAIEQAVKDGDLTQEQADTMLERQTERFADVDSYDDLGSMKGGQGGRHGGSGNGNGKNQ